MPKYKKVIISTLLLFVYFSSQNIINNISIKTYSLFKSTKEVSASITVPGNNYCLNNGFDKLSDCMLVMENYSESVSAAKTYIEKKGTATYSSIAPTITNKVYSELVDYTNTDNYIISTSSHFSLAKSYIFNADTGMFTIGEVVDGTFTEQGQNVDLTRDYLNYYTCGDTMSTWTTCPIIYQIKDYRVENDGVKTNYFITKAIVFSYNVVDALDSEVGLYSAKDDLGMSYFYRGNVTNNYVSYAGDIWKIIRRNGDGSIRIIYNGKSTSDTYKDVLAEIGPFDYKPYDPAYLGYMYTENFALNETKNSINNFIRFTENTNYYFADGWNFDENTKKFNLIGNKISGIWKNVYTQVLSKYPYTCVKSNADDTCDFILKVTSYVNSYTMKARAISYSSINYESSLTPNTNSSVKTKVDSWYEKNIVGKKDSKSNLYSSYLTDGIFCNDRKINSGSGYLLAPGTTYKSFARLGTTFTPELTCAQSIDKFTTTTTLGNGALKYPIGLITADEVSMAGGAMNYVNPRFYLYNGYYSWTMTPSFFGAEHMYGRVWVLNHNGELYRAYTSSNANYGIRPVVNLRNDIKISAGNGSSSNPYIVSLS